MNKQQLETTQEALKNISDAVKKLGEAIEYEIHIMRVMETTVTKLAKLFEESK